MPWFTRTYRIHKTSFYSLNHQVYFHKAQPAWLGFSIKKGAIAIGPNKERARQTARLLKSILPPLDSLRKNQKLTGVGQQTLAIAVVYLAQA